MKSIFSKSVLKTTGRELKKEITEAVMGTKALKKVVNMICQQANRRIQNIEKAGLASPAVKAVYAERGKKGYTYFTTAGLDPNNKTDWELIKYEYGRAMSFLNNPTSSATGARQYIRNQAKELDIPFDSANRIIDLATSPTIDNNGNVNIFSYGSILDGLKNDVMQTENEMRQVGKAYGEQLEMQLQSVINSITAQASQPFLGRFIQ